MNQVYFKIRVNKSPLAGCFVGETTGLDSAIREFNKRLRHGKECDCVELVAYDGRQVMTLRKEYVEP